MLTLDQEHLKGWAEQKNLSYNSWEELLKSEEVINLINNEIEEKNKSLSSFETLKKYIISPREFSIESGELTPSFKVKRHVVTENFRSQLDSLYED